MAYRTAGASLADRLADALRQRNEAERAVADGRREVAWWEGRAGELRRELATAAGARARDGDGGQRGDELARVTEEVRLHHLAAVLSAIEVRLRETQAKLAAAEVELERAKRAEEAAQALVAGEGG